MRKADLIFEVGLFLSAELSPSRILNPAGMNEYGRVADPHPTTLARNPRRRGRSPDLPAMQQSVLARRGGCATRPATAHSRAALPISRRGMRLACPESGFSLTTQPGHYA
jgi:hypothetical protein